MRADPFNSIYLPARAVWERYGVSDMTIYRWLQDDRMGFPKPTYFGRNRYWRLADLKSWELAKAVKSKALA